MNYYRLHCITLPLVLLGVFALGGMSLPSGFISAVLMIFSLAILLFFADIIFLLFFGLLCTLLKVFHLNVSWLAAFDNFLRSSGLIPLVNCAKASNSAWEYFVLTLCVDAGC